MQVESPEELWGNSFSKHARGTANLGTSDSAGQICASILVKLIMDMYLKAGPAVAYPLALLMLQRYDTCVHAKSGQNFYKLHCAVAKRSVVVH